MPSRKRPNSGDTEASPPKKIKSSKPKQPKAKESVSRQSIPQPGPHTWSSSSSLPLSFAELMLAGDQIFYQSGSGNTTTPPAQQNLNKIFDQYRDQPTTEPDKIGINGAQPYLTDLGVELDEVAHLALCDLLQCPSIGEFEREPFVSGWRSLTSKSTSPSVGSSYDTIAKQSSHIKTMRTKLGTDPTYFKQVYRNAFKLAKQENQRSVPMDSAVEFWRMFFTSGKGGLEWNTDRTKWLELWIEYYESKNKRPVNKDLWNMVGELVLKTREPDGEDLGWWKEDGAWPMAVDDFVAYVQSKRKDEGGKYGCELKTVEVYDYDVASTIMDAHI